MFTYRTTGASGWFSFAALRTLTGSMAAMGHRALAEGMIIFLSWLRMDALSAMKSTPQKTMRSTSPASWALLLNCKESPTKSPISCISGIW